MVVKVLYICTGQLLTPLSFEMIVFYNILSIMTGWCSGASRADTTASAASGHPVTRPGGLQSLLLPEIKICAVLRIRLNYYYDLSFGGGSNEVSAVVREPARPRMPNKG